MYEALALLLLVLLSLADSEIPPEKLKSYIQTPSLLKGLRDPIHSRSSRLLASSLAWDFGFSKHKDRLHPLQSRLIFSFLFLSISI